MKTGKKKTDKAGHPASENISSAGDLTQAEISGPEDKSPSTAASDTDDDEDEGVGDGKMGRSREDISKR